MPIETAPAGATLHAVAEEGIPGRDFAEVIRHKLDIPVISVAPENALDHFGFLGFLLPMDSPASSEYARQVLGWEPTGLSLLEDLDQTTTTEPKFPDPS